MPAPVAPGPYGSSSSAAIDEVLDTTTLADMAEDYKQQRLHIQTLENHTEVRG